MNATGKEIQSKFVKAEGHISLLHATAHLLRCYFKNCTVEISGSCPLGATDIFLEGGRPSPHFNPMQLQH